MAHFEKREWDENTWNPNVCGVDLTERFYRFMGRVASDGTELYTAWLVTEDADIQITPETCRVFVSLVDDDSDTVTVLDPSDGMWFSFLRASHSEQFDTIASLIGPWATVTTSLTPNPEVYSRFLKTVTTDTETDNLFIPDGWE
jgi:hypothetical protein